MVADSYGTWNGRDRGQIPIGVLGRFPIDRSNIPLVWAFTPEIQFHDEELEAGVDMTPSLMWADGREASEAELAEVRKTPRWTELLERLEAEDRQAVLTKLSSSQTESVDTAHRRPHCVDKAVQTSPVAFVGEDLDAAEWDDGRVNEPKRLAL